MDAKMMKANAQAKKRKIDEPQGIKTLFKEPEYEAAGLKYNVHGVLYQVRFLMLFVSRGVNRGVNDFKLATEMTTAESMDDIVFRHRNAHDYDARFVFIQVKHKLYPERDKITLTELKKKANSKSNDFSIKKYFHSFCKIRDINKKQNMEFLLCTNTTFESDVQNYFTEDPFDKDDILYLNRNEKKFKVNKELINDLFKKEEEEEGDDDDGEKNKEEFLSMFRFVVNYPNEEELDKFIEKEIGEKLGIPKYAKLVNDSFGKEMINFLKSYKTGKAEFYSFQDGKNFFFNIIGYLYLLEQLNKVSMDNKESVIKLAKAILIEFDHFEIFLPFFKSYLDKDSLKKILLTVDSFGETILCLPARRGNIKNLKFLSSLIQESFGTDTLKELISNTLYYFIELQNVEDLQSYLKCLVDLSIDIEELILNNIEDNNGTPILHYAAESKFPQVLETILDFLKENVKPDTLKNLILMKIQETTTILNCCKPKSVEIISQLVKTHFGVEVLNELKNMDRLEY